MNKGQGWGIMSTMCSCGENQRCATEGDNMFVPHVNLRTGQPCEGLSLSRMEAHWRAKRDEADQ